MEPSARRIQPALATCSYHAYRPEMGRPICISLVRPKSSIEADRMWPLTPRWSYFRASPEEFDRHYLAQLDKVGVAGLWKQFEALDDGRPLILLCFERNPRSGADCHRRRFAEWWRLQTGEIIPEIGSDPPLIGTDQPLIFPCCATHDGPHIHGCVLPGDHRGQCQIEQGG